MDNDNSKELAKELLKDIDEVEEKIETTPEEEKKVKLSGTQLRKQKKQMRNQMRMMARWKSTQAKKNRLLRGDLKRAKFLVGKDAYNDLREICTIPIPEQKDKDGKVTEEASSYVNKYALINELRNLIVLKREDRIQAGKRKRSTGRSSQRKTHSGTVRLLNKRSSDTITDAGKEMASRGNI